MKEKKPIKISLTSAIMIVLIIVLVIAGIAYYLFINKPTDSVSTTNTQNEISTTENVTATPEISEKLTMTEEEFPKVDGATAMLPMVGEITKSVLGYTDEQAQKYLDENYLDLIRNIYLVWDRGTLLVTKGTSPRINKRNVPKD